MSTASQIINLLAGTWFILLINCEPTVARRGVYWFRNLATVSYGSQRISFLSWEFYFCWSFAWSPGDFLFFVPGGYIPTLEEKLAVTRPTWTTTWKRQKLVCCGSYSCIFVSWGLCSFISCRFKPQETIPREVEIKFHDTNRLSPLLIRWCLPNVHTRLFRENLLHEKLNNREEESRHKDEERHVPAHVHGLVPSQQLVYPLGTTVRQHFLSWDCSVVSRSWKRRCQHTITPSESFVKRLFHHQTGFWS